MPTMPMLTRAFGTAFIVLGLGAWLLTGADSPTALLPALLGVLLWVCALVAARGERVRMHAMHTALLLAVLALLGSLPPVADLPALLTGGAADRSGAAVTASTLTVLLAAGYLTFGIRSFIQARRAREDADPA